MPLLQSRHRSYRAALDWLPAQRREDLVLAGKHDDGNSAKGCRMSDSTRNGVKRSECGHGCGWEWYFIVASEASRRTGELAYLAHLRDEHDSEKPTVDSLADLFAGFVR